MQGAKCYRKGRPGLIGVFASGKGEWDMVVAERRAFPCHEVSLKAYVHLRIGSESHVVIGFPATIRSISRGGARLKVPPWVTSYLHPGKTAFVRIEHPELSATELRSRVVWFRESQLAVAFAGRTDSERPQRPGAAWAAFRPGSKAAYAVGAPCDVTA